MVDVTTTKQSSQSQSAASDAATATTASPSSSATPPDLRPLLDRAMTQVESLLAGASHDQERKPTPCDEFDVAALIGHIQAVIRRAASVLSGEPFHLTPTHVESSDWVADWQEGCRTARQVLADDSTLTRQCLLPWGTLPGAAAIGGYLAELTVHGWDLAVATDQRDRLDQELAAASMPVYEQILPAAQRPTEIPFETAVPVDDQADPYDRLVAWSGRDPNWHD